MADSVRGRYFDVFDAYLDLQRERARDLGALFLGAKTGITVPLQDVYTEIYEAIFRQVKEDDTLFVIHAGSFSAWTTDLFDKYLKAQIEATKRGKLKVHRFVFLTQDDLSDSRRSCEEIREELRGNLKRMLDAGMAVTVAPPSENPWQEDWEPVWKYNLGLYSRAGLGYGEEALCLQYQGSNQEADEVAITFCRPDSYTVDPPALWHKACQRLHYNAAKLWRCPLSASRALNRRLGKNENCAYLAPQEQKKKETEKEMEDLFSRLSRQDGRTE